MEAIPGANGDVRIRFARGSSSLLVWRYWLATAYYRPWEGEWSTPSTGWLAALLSLTGFVPEEWVAHTVRGLAYAPIASSTSGLPALTCGCCRSRSVWPSWPLP